MWSRRIISSIIIIIFSFTVLTAHAGLHFVGGGSVGGGSVYGWVDTAGVGNHPQYVSVWMNIKGTVYALCKNKGENFAPGQNPLDYDVTAYQQASIDSNGRATANFHVDLLTVSKKKAGCPNGNWTMVDFIGTLYVTFTAYDAESDTWAGPLVLMCEYTQSDAGRDEVKDCVEL